MNTSSAQKKRTVQAYYESQAPPTMSARNMALTRVEMLLSEQFIVPFPGEEESVDFGPVELINVDDIIEVAQLPPSVTALPVTDEPLPQTGEPLPQTEESLPHSPLAVAVETPPKKISLLAATLQILVVLFVMTWVFIFGIMVGRGQVWEAGPGHDLVVWLEQKAGWVPKTDPEVVIKGTEAEPLPATSEQSNPAPLATSANQTLTFTKSDMDIAIEKVSDTWAGQQWLDENASFRQTQTLLAQADTESSSPEQALPARPASSQTPPVTETNQQVAEPVSTPEAITEISEEKFAVQAASTPDEAEAKKQVTKLEEKGLTAYSYRNTTGLWVVRVGHFDSRQKADKVRLDLLNMGYTNPYVSRLTE